MHRREDQKPADLVAACAEIGHHDDAQDRYFIHQLIRFDELPFPPVAR